MEKFEYDYKTVKGLGFAIPVVEDQLNELGKEGWRLVSDFQETSAYDSCEMVGLFMRKTKDVDLRTQVMEEIKVHGLTGFFGVIEDWAKESL